MAKRRPEFNWSNRTRALLGEARAQGDKEFLAHAEAMTNRGTMEGVYGLNAAHLQKWPVTAGQQKRAEWATATAQQRSAVLPPTYTSWFSDYDLGEIAKKPKVKQKQYFADLSEPIRIGNTVFYKNRSRASKRAMSKALKEGK